MSVWIDAYAHDWFILVYTGLHWFILVSPGLSLGLLGLLS